MSDNPAEFIGDIPKYYDTGLGPNIFVDYGDRLVAASCDGAATNVIELAAGTGIVSRKLRDRLDPDARLLVTDLNAPMLDVARAKFSERETVEFTVANAMTLPFDDDAFDLVVCQFGVMFFPDKPASFREAARVLKPGGRYVFNVWSAMEENPFSIVAHETSARFFPEDPPGFYKVPFHYGDPEKVREDLSSAGWRDVSHETIPLDKRIVNPEAFARALVFGNPLIDEIRTRGGVDPEYVAAAMAEGITARFGPSDMTMPLSATMFVCEAA